MAAQDLPSRSFLANFSAQRCLVAVCHVPVCHLSVGRGIDPGHLGSRWGVSLRGYTG